MPVELQESTFSLTLPEGFSVSRDSEGLQCVSSAPPGVLSLTPEAVVDKDSLPNLSRMLAGFLTRSGHPVATDELLKMTVVPEAHGFSWQYIEDEKYHRFWLFGNESSWLLLTFVCPSAHQRDFHEPLRKMIVSLRLLAPKS